MGGGKAKHQQRTKNNARPSNSSRSAQLIEKATTTTTAFQGFGHDAFGFAAALAEKQTLQSTEAISANCRIVLGKLIKKDAVTKKKGLQELTELLTQADEQELCGVLSVWPKLYAKLANDEDSAVREHSQRVLQLLAEKGKRKLAPYLKELMPVWLASHFDSHAPTAAVAINCFQQTFNQKTERTREVLLHCQQSIVSYAMTNLSTKMTLETAVKFANAEEAERSRERLLVSSLKMLSFLLMHLKEKRNEVKNEQHEQQELQRSFDNLLSEQKFWTLCKHKTPVVRAAWYQLLHKLLTADVAENWLGCKQQLIKSCLQAIDETDARVLTQLWNCVTTLALLFSDWADFIDLQKALLPKFYALLRAGLQYNDRQINEQIRQFLKQLARAVAVKKTPTVQHFWQQIFVNLQEAALEQPKQAVVRFKEEQSMLDIYFEILQIACEELVLNEQEFLLQLLEEHLNLKSTSLLLNKSVQFKQFFLDALAFLAWLQSQTQFEQTNLAERAAKSYWRRVFDALTEHIQQVEQEYLPNAVLVLTQLQAPAQQQQLHMPVAELQLLNSKTAQLCLQQIKAEQLQAQHIQLLHELLDSMPDKTAFLQQFTHEELDNILDTFSQLLTKLADEQTCHLLFNLIFNVLSQYETAQRLRYIQQHLLRIERSEVQTFALKQLFNNSIDLQTIGNLDELILQTAQRAAQEECHQLLQALKQCSISKSAAGDFILKTDTLLELLNISISMLLHGREQLSQACARFIADLYEDLSQNEHTSIAVKKQLYLKALALSLEAVIFEKELLPMCLQLQSNLLNEKLVQDEALLNECLTIIKHGIDHACRHAEQTIKIDGLVTSISNFIKSFPIDKMQLMMSRIFAQLTDAELILSQDCQLMEAFILQKSAWNLQDDANAAVADSNKAALQLQCILLNLLKFHILTNLFVDQPTSLATADLYSQLTKCFCMAGIADSYAANDFILSNKALELCQQFQQNVVNFLKQQDAAAAEHIENALLSYALGNDMHIVDACRALKLLLHLPYYADFEENAHIILLEKLLDHFLSQNCYKGYLSCLQNFLPQVPAKSINISMQHTELSLGLQAALYRCLIKHNCSSNYSDLLQKQIMQQIMQFILQNAEKTLQQPELLLYRQDINEQPMAQLLAVIEYIYLINDVIEHFPQQLTVNHWDGIRIGLGSWTLSLSQSTQQPLNIKLTLFTLSVYKTYAALTNFLETERQRSSTKLIKQLTDEWDNVYARQMHASLFKSFIALVQTKTSQKFQRFHTFLALICNTMVSIDANIILTWLGAGKREDALTLFRLLLDCLGHSSHSVRMHCANLLKQLLPSFIAKDIKTIAEIESGELSKNQHLQKQHFLLCFKNKLDHYDAHIKPYLEEFSFKLNEIQYFEPLPTNICLAYLSIWQCIIELLSKSPESLRAIYIKWLHNHKYNNSLLHFLFRSMPSEVLRNYNAKWSHNSDIFNKLDESVLSKSNLPLELRSCHTYRQLLSQLPGLVRKWWTTSASRQKNFVEQFTKNYVSQLIVNEEFDALANRKEQHENMQMSLRKSTREIVAVYCIDDVRMDIVITMAANHPLGSVKVVCGKQIGGLTSAQTMAMQLTLFLTHQNGSIFEGLAIWKKNLDKRFQNVEQCNVCFCVVHNETCDLPKITCKTCKKKFHSSCLFKWFRTSSKSTCPLCRHLF